jgi:hypothetical protein
MSEQKYSLVKNLKCFGMGLAIDPSRSIYASIERENIMTPEQWLNVVAKWDAVHNKRKPLATHAERVKARQAINGQPNGYQPISEAELQARKASLHYAEMSRVVSEELKAEFEPS